MTKDADGAASGQHPAANSPTLRDKIERIVRDHYTRTGEGMLTDDIRRELRQQYGMAPTSRQLGEALRDLHATRALLQGVHGMGDPNRGGFGSGK